MGHRTVKRVPLDFDWPQGKVWEGYLPPTWRACPNPDCENGSTTAGRWLECFAHLILMAGEAGARPGERLHPWLAALPLVPDRAPGPDMAALTEGLAGRSGARPLGHDALDQWAAKRKIAESASMPADWGICPTCKGHAMHPDDVAASEAWEGTDPPVGEGWQLWEMTSEGSPQSPVFATPEELARWCTDNATIWASETMPYGRWLALILEDDMEFGSLAISDGQGYFGSVAQAPMRSP